MLRKSCLFSLAALLGACAAVPDVPAPAALRTPAALPTAEALAGVPTAAGWPAEAWWHGYGDPQLDALIAEGLAGNPDVTAAAARLAEADAIARQSRAALLPSLAGNASVGGQVLSKNQGFPPQFVPSGVLESANINLFGGIDLDLWGRNRAALRAARGEAAAAAVEAAQARLLVASGIVVAYADFAAGLERETVARRSVEIRAATARLTRERVAIGLDNEGAVAQADSRLAQARSDLEGASQAVRLTRHRLAALLGAGPDRGLTIAAPALRPLPAGVPAGAGVGLAARRPDLIAARLRAEAAAARVQSARAAFYPDIRLSAVVGQQSLGFDKLLEGSSFYTQFGPALSLPIFQGGLLSARYRGARAGQDAAIAQYDATLIGALREVADAATNMSAVDRQLAEARAALREAQRAREIAALRYGGGLASQLPVLTADDSVVLTERAVADLAAQRLVADVALVRALGGGFRTDGAK